MSGKTVKRIPYGISNYGIIRRENYYYVDKTPYLEKIQQIGRYLFFIRPRRFGKSLFVSLMEAYYDVSYKERFEELFKGTWIYRHPTSERGTYLVLSLNFSAVEPAANRVESSFLNQIRGRALLFFQKYSDYLIEDRAYFKRAIEESHSASDILEMINNVCRASGQKLYVIIDEYDNFANTILSTAGEEAYQTLTHGEGFFRAFFNVLKAGTSGMDAPVARMFLTGVSPITLDDVTSGYNIGKNVSLERDFNRMLGFTADDVVQLLEYYRSKEMIPHETGPLLALMEEWYGNYLFSEDDDVRLFNSDMVLYFVDHYLNGQKLPKDLIDRNVRIDYGKLRHLVTVDKGRGKTANGNFNRLREIIARGEIAARIQRGFPFEKLMDQSNFISLLFYFGLLTIKGAQLDELVFSIPNETVRRLYYDYIKEGYEETDVFTVDLYTYDRLMKDMAVRGEWKPLFDYITGRMRDSMSLRDLITGEKSVQAFLNVYLGLSNLYIVHTERELNKGYADLVMEPFLSGYGEIKYAYIVEVKYMKAGEKGKGRRGRIEQLKAEAERQLKNYSMDEKFRKSIEKTTLIKLVLIFSGYDLVHMARVD